MSVTLMPRSVVAEILMTFTFVKKCHANKLRNALAAYAATPAAVRHSFPSPAKPDSRMETIWTVMTASVDTPFLAVFVGVGAFYLYSHVFALVFGAYALLPMTFWLLIYLFFASKPRKLNEN